MATNQGSEGARLAIKATLGSFLAGKLSALNAAYNDGLPLLAPVQIYAYKQDIIPEFPAVQIYSLGGTVQIDGATVWNQMGHDVVVQWFVVADSETNLEKMTDRYMLAIQQVLQENKGLDGSLDGGVGIILKRYQMGEVARDKQIGILLHTGAWQCTVEAVELLR